MANKRLAAFWSGYRECKAHIRLWGISSAIVTHDNLLNELEELERQQRGPNNAVADLSQYIKGWAKNIEKEQVLIKNKEQLERLKGRGYDVQ